MGFLDFLSPKKKTIEEKKQKIIEELNYFIEQVNAKKALTPITTQSILLKEGENAYLETDTILQETRAIRYHKRGGMGFRVMKGVYVGGMEGTSESREEWRVIDRGRLILTNKRLVFDGVKENRIIPLEKIFAVNPSLDSIRISAENRKKDMLFAVDNPFIWATVIQLLIKSGGNPTQIDNVTVDIKFK